MTLKSVQFIQQIQSALAWLCYDPLFDDAFQNYEQAIGAGIICAFHYVQRIAGKRCIKFLAKFNRLYYHPGLPSD